MNIVNRSDEDNKLINEARLVLIKKNPTKLITLKFTFEEALKCLIKEGKNGRKNNRTRKLRKTDK